LFPPWRSPIADDEDQFTDAQQRDLPPNTPRTQRTIRQAKNKEKRAKASSRSIQFDTREPLRPLDNHHSYHDKEQQSESSESETETMVSTRHLQAKKAKAAEENKKKKARKNDEEEAQAEGLSQALEQLPPDQLQALMKAAFKKAGVDVPLDAPQKPQAKAKNGDVPLDGGQKALNSVQPNVQAEADRLLNLCLTGKQKKAKKGMENLIRDVVRNHLFRIIKFIPNLEVQKIAVKKVRKWLNFSAMRGDSLEAQQLADEFDEANGSLVTRLLNEHRSYVTSQVKEVMHKYFLAHNNTLPTPEELVALLTRDFEVQGPEPGLNEDDYAQLRWYITEFLPKACGNQADWGPDHHLYMTVQKGAPPKRPKRLYVTSTTEAFGVWVVENNREAWPAQWAAKALHGSYGIIRKTKGPNGEDLTDETSIVSLPFFVNLHLILSTCT